MHAHRRRRRCALPQVTDVLQVQCADVRQTLLLSCRDLEPGADADHAVAKCSRVHIR